MGKMMMDTAWIAKVWNEEHPAPRREIECRHCHAINRVPVDKAVLYPHKAICAQCKKLLFLANDEPLTGISSRSFENPLDSETLGTVRAIPGASALMKLVHKRLNESKLLFHMKANAIECNDEQFPELVAIVKTILKRLDCQFVPQVYFSSMPFVNAFTSGGEEAVICFSTALLNQLDDRELEFVTGHEFGHLMAEHVISRLILQVVLNGSFVALPGIARYLSMPLKLALLKWARCSELTADRAGLLACRDVTVALNCMMKMASGYERGVTERTQLSLAAFVAQAISLGRQEGDHFDSMMSSLFAGQQSHPFIAWRVMELIDWVEKGNYFDILAGKYV
jgi:Zn-dependent protease with chaperone function